MKWLLLTLLLLVILILIAMTMRGGIPVQTAVVRRGAIQEFVDEQAKTQLPRTYEVTMPFAARVEAISLREGDLVKEGQTVARIVRQDLEDEVAEARAAVDRLTARIAENDDVTIETSARDQANLFVESMKSTVAAAEARKTAGKSRLDYSETSLGRYRALLESNASTKEQVEQLEMQYIQSQVDYRQDVLNAAALQALQSATDIMPRMITEYIGRKRLTHNVLLQEKAEADARLRRALLRQERGDMQSPTDGVVLDRVVSNEQYQAPGAVILRLGKIEQLEVIAELLSEDVGRIRENDPVIIYGPAIGSGVEKGVAGTVRRIYPTGFMKMSSLGVEQQRVKVVIAFADGVLKPLLDGQHLGVDFRVRVRIITETKADAVVIPRSALFRGPDTQWQVFKIHDEKASKQTIQVGLMNEALAEVVDGLVENDQVIIAPDTEVRDGVKVEPRPQ